MKKLFVLVFVAFVSTSVFSTNENPEKQEIRTKIVQLLGNPDFLVDEKVKTTVDFLINKNGEIVILNVDCNTPKIPYYIKNKLNYKTINKNFNGKNTFYKMPLVIKNGSK